MSTDQATLEEFDELEERDVYVTSTVSRGAGIYHTDPECQFVTDRHKQITLSNARDRDLDECTYCAGEHNPGNPRSDAERCSVPTTKGHPCRMHSLAGFDRCSRHLNFDDGDETDDSSTSNGEADRPVWERQKDDLLGDSE